MGNDKNVNLKILQAVPCMLKFACREGMWVKPCLFHILFPEGVFLYEGNHTSAQWRSYL